MDSLVEKRAAAWRPFTPRGVAMFAQATLGRLLLVQLVTAVLAAGSTVWALSHCWFPVINSSIDHLPQQGAIQGGRLNWTGESPQSLAENRFLSLAVDLDHSGLVRSPSQIQVEFGRASIKVYSLFGWMAIPYPGTYSFAFNYQELKPWWGAWAPVILALAAAGVVAGLLMTWMVLATVYCLPAWLIGLYLNRELTLCGSWRVAGAALVPGALVMSGAIIFYALAALDLVRLMASVVFHFMLGWVYLVLSAAAAPKLKSELLAPGNPFSEVLDSEKTSDKEPKKAETNPFRLSRD
jgi:hypothetical protein